MTDITSGCTIKEIAPHLAAKCVMITTAATADHADTIVMTLSSYGMSTFLGCLTFRHTTENSVAVLETTDASTTAVSSGVLTVTIGGSNDNYKRVLIIYGE